MATYYRSYKTAAGTVEISILDHGIADTSDIELKDIGKIEIGFDDDSELIFYPSNIKLVFKDTNRNLFHELKYNDRYVQIELNSAIFYYGRVEVMQTRRSDNKRDTEIVVFDNSSLLKSIKIKDNGGNSLNPLGYTDMTWKRFTIMIEDVFKQVNPSVDIEINQDWRFKVSDADGAYDVPFADIEGQVNYVFFGVKPFSTLAGFLRGLAQMFGCVAGMVSYSKAYFVKQYKSSLTPVSLTNKVKTCERMNLLRKLDGIRTNQIYPTYGGGVHDEGTVDPEISGEFKYPDKVLQIDLYWGCNEGADTYSTIRDYDGDLIRKVKDPFLGNDFYPSKELIAKYHYGYRTQNRQKYELTARGLDYNIWDIYTYDYLTLRPSKIEYDIVNNETKITAIDIT